MYSGITRGLFEVTAISKHPDFMTYSVRLNPILVEKLQIGASVAIDGVCQTVVSIADCDVTFQAIQDTLVRSTLRYLELGSKVSVERSLRYGDEVGGHEIAGHVFGMGTIHAISPKEHSLDMIIQCPQEWMKFIFTKGYIAVDGCSLTVDQADSKGYFTLHLIPETLRLTQFGIKRVGDAVNIELDHKTQTIVSTVERVLAQSPELQQIINSLR